MWAKRVGATDIFYLFVTRQTLLSIFGDTCSWKEQLEKTRSWKVRHEIEKNEVGKFEPKLESTTEVEKFPTSLGSFQLRLALSNFRLSNLKLSNYTYPDLY